jgi:iron complex transport system permease protein
MIRLVACLLLLAAGLLLVGAAYGDQSIAWADLLAVLRGSGSPEARFIMLELRLPRMLLAMLAGMGLAVAGAIAQAVMRNALAEPGILGINAGAAFAASLVIVAFPGVHPDFLPWAGFLGALVLAAAVFGLAWRRGTSSLRIILVGIGLSSLAAAGTSFMTVFGRVIDVQRAMIWLAGSVYGADWNKVHALLLWLAGPMALAWLSFRELDLIRFGDDATRSLGQRVDRTRAGLILLCTLISGATVAAVGLIGFVGLVAPHLARKLVGPGHAGVLPVSALLGGLLLMAADFAGRTVIAPAQLPAGLVTALIGAPFFAWLLRGGRHVAA